MPEDAVAKLLAGELAEYIQKNQPEQGLTPTPEPMYQDDEDTTVTSTSWSIQNVPSLDWALSRVTALKREVASVEAQYEAAVRRLQARRDNLIERANRGVAFFESQIARYATENRENLLGGGAKKSRALLNGLVGWRKRAGRLVVVDADTLARWLQAQSDVSLYRVKIEPEMKALQANYQKNGVIPPGTEYQVEQEKFYIETADVNTSLEKKGNA